MKKEFLRLALLSAALACGAATARADIRVKTKTTVMGHASEGVTMVKGARQRTEGGMGSKTVTVQQCDLRRNVQINDAAQTYLVMPFDEGAAEGPGAAPSSADAGAPAAGGSVLYKVESIDTGERKEMFGMTARHVKTTITAEAAPDSCAKSMKTVLDGWYVDLPGFNCAASAPPTQRGMPSTPGCRDQVRYKTSGTGKRGFALDETITMYDGEGRQTMEMRREVVELTRDTLDAALFEVPAGYREVNGMSEFYGSGGGATGGALASALGRPARTEPSAREGAPSSSSSSSAATSAAAPGSKGSGVVRIGLVLPRAQMREGGISNEAAAEALRKAFASLLKGPTLETVALDARMPAQAAEEARQKGCDFVLVAGLVQKKGGGMFGGGGMLGQLAGAATGQIPGGDSAGEAVARTAAAEGVYDAAQVAESIHNKDEVTLDYKLLPSADISKPAAAGAQKAKARSDGDDVLSPLVQKAAEAVSAAARK